MEGDHPEEWTSLPGGLSQDSPWIRRRAEELTRALQVDRLLRQGDPPPPDPPENDEPSSVALEIDGDEWQLQAFSWMDGEEYWRDVTEEDLRRNGWVRKDELKPDSE